MKKYLLYIISLILIAVSACHKTAYPKPVEPNDSFFYADLLVNGQPLNLTTGKDGYYMYSSYSIDSSGIYNLTGEFKQTSCSNNCPNSLRIQINDSKISSPNSSILIDSALQLKNYSFLSGLNDVGYSVDFSGLFNKGNANASYLWDFGDGATSTGSSPSHPFKAGKYRVSLTITGPNMCQSVMINTLSLLSANDLNVFVNTSTTSSNTVLFTALASGGKPPYKYEWEYGDGDTDTTLNKSISHSYNIKGGYGVILKVTDSDGKTTSCNYNAVAGGDVSACASNFTFSNITSVPRRSGLSKVGIRFTDANGLTYTSDNSAQSGNSSFQIISVDEFVKNENNQPVKKVHLKFNCTLYNSSQSITLQGTEVYVGVAYK